MTVGGKTVELDRVADKRIVGAFRSTADSVAAALAPVRCPEHSKPPAAVRIHFDAQGAADLKYDACCEKLSGAIQQALGE